MKIQAGIVAALLVGVVIVLPGQAAAQSPTVGWQPKQSVIESWYKRRAAGVNFDESRVPEYQLPDPLVSEDGRPVTNPQDWTTNRRPALLQLFRENVYGVRPTTDYKVDYEEVGRRENAFGIGATARQIRTTIRARGKSHAFDFVIVVPKSETRVPVVVHINNRYLVPVDKAVDEFDPFWPVEKLVRRGYATVGFHTSHVDPDKRDGYEAGIRAMLEDPDSDPETRWKCLSAWAWGASRVLDFALKQPEIDPKRTAVAGNSRAGKTALWAGAEDERFQIVYSNESGCGGAALSRRAFGETVARINKNFPHWFCERFKAYGGRESELPVDQHELIALIAPRAVYVASADEDLWADPRGEYASLIAAGPVFDLFGLKHITEPAMPPLNSPRHVGSTGYHIRTGVHNLTEQDWGCFLDFADSVFARPTIGDQPTAEAASVISKGQLPNHFKNSLGAELVMIPAGKFVMGTDESEAGRRANELQHTVIFTKPFYMGIHEVTQAQWQSLMGDNPSHFKGEALPVETVSWDDCQEFCQRLTKKDSDAKRIPGDWKYRLPTESEREYACRAETTTAFHYGNSLDSTQANINGEEPYGDAVKNVNRQKTIPVGSFKPNAWGLYDMHGNVYEWCQSFYGGYPSGEVTDPAGPGTGGRRVYRGGAWKFNAATARSAKRSWRKPSFAANFMGLRVVLVPGK